jgi:signal transduction histidine kinase
VTALLDRPHKVFSTTAFRLTAAAVALFVLAAAAIAVILFWQSNKVLTGQVLTTLQAEAQILKAEAAGGGIESLTATIAASSRPEGPGLYYLVDDNGNKLAGNLNRMPPELLGGRGGVFRYAGESERPGHERLAVAIPVNVGKGARLIIGRDIEDQRAFADTMKRIFLVGFGAVSAIGLLGGLVISRLVLARLETITQTSKSIMEGDLSRRIPIEGNGGELDGLAENLNDMLDRIEGLMSGLREVSDNIAHDLKTPISRLRNSAEAALRDPRGEDAYREGLERTIEKADDLIKTFNALLLIARLEAGPLEESLEQFDLGQLVEDVAELYMPAAEEAGFALTVETAKGMRVNANRQLMGQALANLIDNAIKYSRGGTAGGDITVNALPLTNGDIEISVGDHGPGISDQDKARVLKRFVRLEQSRTKPGTGLGLSLVAAVARLHGGRVRLEDNAPGLRVVLVLPARVTVALAAGRAPELQGVLPAG